MGANALDFGSTGDVPPLFAQAAGGDLLYVAATKGALDGSAIVVKKDSPIQTLADLKGKKITIARQLIEQRRRRGKTFGGPSGKKGGGKLSPSALIRTYQQDVERKRQMVRKAESTRDRLTFVVQALRTLFADDGLMTVLRGEGLDTLPRNLANRLQGV